MESTKYIILPLNIFCSIILHKKYCALHKHRKGTGIEKKLYV